MPKLENVKVLSGVERISVDGTEYEKVERKAEKGDVIRYTGGSRYVTHGGFYAVTGIDWANDPLIIDNDGDNYDLTSAYNYEVFAKVSAKYDPKPGDKVRFKNSGTIRTLKERYPLYDGKDFGKGWHTVEGFGWIGENQFEVIEKATEQYREVKRKAKVGERIRIVDEYITGNKYSNGDEFVVTEVESGNSITFPHVHVDDFELSILHREYVVLEPIEDGRKAWVTNKGNVYLTYSKFAEKHGYPEAADSYRGERRGISDDEEVTLVTSGEHHISGKTLWIVRNDIGEMYIIGEKGLSFEQPKPSRLKVGDYAKVVSNEDGKIAVNTIVKVTADDKSSIPFKAELLDGSDYEWFEAFELTPATDVEVDEAKRKQFAKDDKVRLVSGGGKYPLVGTENGNVYVVFDNDREHEDGKRIFIGRVGGSDGFAFAKPDQLEKVTESKSKLTRDYRDFNVGDSAKITSLSGASRGFFVGDIVKVVSREVCGQYALEIAKGGLIGYVDAEHLEKVTEPSASIGDYAKITEYQCGAPAGTIVKIAKVGAGNTVRYHYNGSRPVANEGCYEVLTPAEAEAHRKQSEESVKWSAIGRKVGEFKRGDVVEVVESGSSGYPAGLIDTIETTNGRFSRSSIRLSTGNRCPYISKNRLKLVTPVESVVNLKA
jgi:hypothetical protein